MKIEVKAPAKINLALDIINKRNDGYHNVKMIMQSISLYDYVTITENNNEIIDVSCNFPSLHQSDSNTAFKAADEFFKYTNIKNPGITIDLYKQIPMCAGLAGGSSDAAAVILGLDKMMSTHLSHSEFAKIGAKIGADVPFCFTGGTMLAEGIGTTLTSIPDMPNCHIVLAKPLIYVSTKEAYELCDNYELSKSKNFDLAVKAIYNKNIEKLGKLIYNKFENVLKIEEVNNIKETMLSFHAEGACMSGSGPSVFGLFKDKNLAYQCSLKLKQNYRDVFICKPIINGCMILNI